MNDEFIYPSELAALVVFLFAPPLLLGLGAQAWFLFRRGICRSRAVVSLVATAFVSSVVSALLFVLGPGFLPRSLGLKDVWLCQHWFPILPLAYFVVALVTPAVSWLSVRHRVRPA